MTTTANDIIKLHKNKVPLIIAEESNIELSKTKFVVPRDLTVGQFHCIIKKYTIVSSKDSIILFINNKLPVITDTIGNLYDLHKTDDNFLYITIKKENTFG